MQSQLTFVPRQEIKSALGTFKDKKQEQFFAGMCKMFTPLEEAKPGDWLKGHKEVHQAFSNYRLPFYNPVTPERNTIYLQQFDIFSKDFIQKLCKFCSLFYPTLNVKCMPVLNFQKELASIKRRDGCFGPQYLAQDILAYMEKRVPKDAYCIMGITLQDIYPGESWNYVYGWAKYKARVGIFSFLRFDDEFLSKKTKEINWEEILYPSMRTMAHEIGHMFGVTHCVYYRCLMNGFNCIEQNYEKPFEFCPICYRKISTNIGFNFVERYTNLLEYCSKSKIELLLGDQKLYDKLLALSKQNPYKIVRQVAQESIQKSPLIKEPIKPVSKPGLQSQKQPVKKPQYSVAKPPIKNVEKPPNRFSVAKPGNQVAIQPIKKPLVGMNSMGKVANLYAKMNL